MKIYTKTGDDGTTALFDGTRVKKTDLRVTAYGDVDELNAMMGICRLYASEGKEILIQIQRDLFAMGAQLANPTHRKQKKKSAFSSERVLVLEKEMDDLETKIDPLKGFLLPGGGALASFLELARTMARRAERSMVRLEDLDPILLQYINRLSDYLFMLARHANKRQGADEIPWDL